MTEFLKSFDHVSHADSPEIVEAITVRFEQTEHPKEVSVADVMTAVNVLMQDLTQIEPPIDAVDASDMLVEIEGGVGSVTYIRRGVRTTLIPADYVVVGWIHELPMQRKSA